MYMEIYNYENKDVLSKGLLDKMIYNCLKGFVDVVKCRGGYHFD